MKIVLTTAFTKVNFSIEKEKYNMMQYTNKNLHETVKRLHEFINISGEERAVKW